MPTPKKKTTKAIAKRKSTKAIKPAEGITLHCFEKHTVIPKDDKILENVGRFARMNGIGSYSVFGSSSPSASAMNDSSVRGYTGTELYITKRDKPSA